MQFRQHFKITYMLVSEWSFKRHQAHCGITQGLYDGLKRNKQSVLQLCRQGQKNVYSWRQAQENMQPGTSAVKSAGKHVTDGRGGKTCKNCKHVNLQVNSRSVSILSNIVCYTALLIITEFKPKGAIFDLQQNCLLKSTNAFANNRKFHTTTQY